MAPQRNPDITFKIVLTVLAFVVLAPILMMILIMPMFGMWGGMMGCFNGGAVSPVWGFGMSLLWLVVLLGGGYLVYRGLVRSGAVPSDTAIEELRLAYARGDLTDEEFEDRREKLSKD